MNHHVKIAVVVLFSMLLVGCDQLSGKKELETKVAALTEALNAKDQEILKLKEDLAALQTPATPEAQAAAVELSAKQIQTGLKNAGFDVGKIDGKIGPKTKEAIRLFQEGHGLPADGNLNAETAAELKKYL